MAKDGDANHRALRFFERPWQYDQVVFDASRAVSREQSGADAVFTARERHEHRE